MTTDAPLVVRVPRDPSAGLLAYRVKCACGWLTMVLPFTKDGVLIVNESAGVATFDGPVKCAKCGVLNTIPPIHLEDARHVRMSCCGG